MKNGRPSLSNNELMKKFDEREQINVSAHAINNKRSSNLMNYHVEWVNMCGPIVVPISIHINTSLG